MGAAQHLFNLGIAQPGALDEDGRTPLQLALFCGSTSVVEYLQQSHKVNSSPAVVRLRRPRRLAKVDSLAKAIFLTLLIYYMYWYAR